MDRKQIEGRCLCGAVTVRGTPVRRHVEACHCTMCRRWSGVAYLGVQCGSDVEFDGEDMIVRYRSSEWAERGFCGRCGSNLFFHYLPKDSYGLLAGLFPDDALLALKEEIFIDEKPAYYTFAGATEKLSGPEVIANAEAQGFTLTRSEAPAALPCADLRHPNGRRGRQCRWTTAAKISSDRCRW